MAAGMTGEAKGTDVESIERELDRLFSLNGRHPVLFWSRWDELVARHHLNRKQADALMARRVPPPRPTQPPRAVGTL
jgi:hypothetical protein